MVNATKEGSVMLADARVLAEASSVRSAKLIERCFTRIIMMMVARSAMLYLSSTLHSGTIGHLREPVARLLIDSIGTSQSLQIGNNT